MKQCLCDGSLPEVGRHVVPDQMMGRTHHSRIILDCSTVLQLRWHAVMACSRDVQQDIIFDSGHM